MKNKLIYIIYFIFIIVFFMYFDNKMFINEEIYDKVNYNLNKNKNSFKININKNLKQIRIIRKDNNTSIDESELKIINSNSDVIYKEKIIGKELSFLSNHTIDVSKLKLKGNYTIVYDYLDNNTINANQKITIQFHYLNNKIVIFRLLYLFISLLFLILIILYKKKLNKLKIEKLFVILAIPLYLLYIIFIPALAGHDEVFHYIKVGELSEGNIIPSMPYNDWSGSFISKGFDLKLPYNANYKYKDVINTLNIKMDNKKEFISAGSVDVYAPIQYIPTVIGIKITKLFTNRSLILTYGGRIFNALVCMILLYFAIKIIPCGKKVVCLFSLSPLLIESFTTLTGDGITNSLCFLFIAYILKLYNSEEITKKQIIFTSILASFLSLLKIVYFLILFIFLLLPKEKFKEFSKSKSIIFIIVIPIILNMIWLFLIRNVTAGSAPYAVPSKKISMFLSNPFIIFKYIPYQIFFCGLDYILDFFSGHMLMCNVIANSYIVPISLLFVSYLLICDNEYDEKIYLSKKQRIFIITLIVAIILFIFLNIYLFYSVLNSKIAYGFQSRYLYPIIPLFIILLKQKIKTKKNKNINLLFISCYVLINFMSLLEIIVNFL